jgi:hypothetical protein
LEHYVFRGGSFKNYDLEAYNNYKALPVGLAAAGACCFGAAGAAVGMAQTWCTSLPSLFLLSTSAMLILFLFVQSSALLAR